MTLLPGRKAVVVAISSSALDSMGDGVEVSGVVHWLVSSAEVVHSLVSPGFVILPGAISVVYVAADVF